MCCGQSNNRRQVQAIPPSRAVATVQQPVQIKYGVTQIMAQRSIQQQQRERTFQKQIMATKQPVIKR